MRNREKINLLGDRHIMGSGTQGSKGRDHNGKGIIMEEVEENSARTQKSRKGERDISRYPRQPL